MNAYHLEVVTLDGNKKQTDLLRSQKLPYGILTRTKDEELVSPCRAPTWDLRKSSVCGNKVNSNIVLLLGT